MQNHNARYRDYSKCDAGVAPTRKSRKSGITIHNLWHGAVLSGGRVRAERAKGEKYEADAAVTSKKPQTPAPRWNIYIFIYEMRAQIHTCLWAFCARSAKHDARGAKDMKKLLAQKAWRCFLIFYLTSACDAQIERNSICSPGMRARFLQTSAIFRQMYFHQFIAVEEFKIGSTHWLCVNT